MEEEITPIKDFFARYIKLAEENVEKLNGLSGKIQFDFTPSNDGLWAFELKEGIVQPLYEGQISNPTVTITAKYEDFFNVRTGKLDPTLAFKEEKIVVTGDKTFTLKLGAAGVS